MRAALRDSGHSNNKWCFALEATGHTYNQIQHSATKEQPHYAWYSIRTSIHQLRVWGCEIFPIDHSPKKLDDRVK